MDEPEGSFRIVVRAGEYLCALRLTDVVEVMRPPCVTPLADAPASVLGLCRVRGAAVPVVDLARLFDEQASSFCSRLVCVRSGERIVGLAVDGVVGFRTFPSLVLSVMPGLIDQARLECIEAIHAQDAGLFFVLDAARLVNSEDWRALESHAGVC